MIRALALMMLATGSAAETPMTATEFDAYVTGRTLTFSTGSGIYGVEQYRPGKRVIWQVNGGDCVEGVWFQRDTNICFLYEHDPEPKCWEIMRTATGMSAEFTNRPGSPVVVEIIDDPRPLICPGPELIG